MAYIQQEKLFTYTLEVLDAIPEFSGGFTPENLVKRLNTNNCILVAFDNTKPVACKIAYNRYADGSFYSWLGGVIPAYRNRGIVKK